jgi:sulfur relay (sulfurtransferase) DsrF/TusC family protein
VSDPPTLLVVIYADPEQTGLTAEALRIAMGLGAGQRTVQVVLMGAAAKVLGDDLDDLIDGDMIENHLDVFADWGTPFHLGGGADAAAYAGAVVDVKPVDDAGLARMMAEADQVMVFP